MANSACVVVTPIHLLPLGNIAKMSHRITADGWDMVLFKADRKASYKQLPIDPDDQDTAIICLKHPDRNRRNGFVARTLIFGSAAAVLRYNVSSRLLVDVANRYVGIPLVGYCDYFAAIARSTLGQASLDAFARFCSMMGFHLKDGNSEMG